MRMSQVLPTVKCSKCCAAISMDDMTTHACSTASNMAPILESPPPPPQPHSGRTMNGQRHQNDGMGNHDHRKLFNSANYATRDPSFGGNARYAGGDHSNPTTNLNDPSVPAYHSQQPAYSNANAVLGRLNSIRPGVLDSKGMHRPIQQARLGPVQTRDPRATIIPIKPGAPMQRYAANSPEPTLGHHATEFSASQDDVSSMASGRSGRSQRSAGHGPIRMADTRQNKSNGPLSASLGADYSGPYHNVGTRLDASIFLPDEALLAKAEKRSGGRRLKSNRKAVYDDEWEENGVEESPLPRRDDRSREQAPPQNRHYMQDDMNTMLPPPRGNMSSSGSTSSDNPANSPRSHPRQQVDQHRFRQRGGHETLEAESVRPRQVQQMVPTLAVRPSQGRPIEGPASRPLPQNNTPMDGGNWQPEPYRSMDTDKPLQQPPLPRHHKLSHTRQATSSSMGTVLTNPSSMHSARSSTSSPPTSEWNYTDREVRYLKVKMATPGSAGVKDDDVTPRVNKPATKKLGGIPKSSTTESFDRLLEDIGSSIDELEVPPAPFAGVENSPSSNYSPIAPLPDKFAQQQRGDVLPPPQRLGSPASLRSKETVHSHPENGHTRTRSRAKEVSCRACERPILGRSVASADGKLSGRYHKDCFRCYDAQCTQSGFANGDFYIFDDRPFCSVHYHQRAGSVCPKCGDGIEGECIATPDGSRFHLHCHTSRHVRGRSYNQF